MFLQFTFIIASSCNEDSIRSPLIELSLSLSLSIFLFLSHTTSLPASQISQVFLLNKHEIEDEWCIPMLAYLITFWSMLLILWAEKELGKRRRFLFKFVSINKFQE